MKKDIVGLIYTGERVDELQELTRYRATAALPMAGRYRLIDFILSNLIHSAVKNIGIVMQKNYHSLMDHIGSGREWNLHGKRSGLTILPPYMTREKVGVYEGLLDALNTNMGFLRRSVERHIVVTDSNVLYQADYREVLEQHLASKADITLLYTKDRNVRRNGRGRYLNVVDGMVEQIEFDPIIPHFENTYMGAFLVRREMLIDLVDRAVASGQHHFSRDLLAQMVSEKIYKIGAYECPGSVFVVDSVQNYYQANMALLNPTLREQVFDDEHPVWTKLRDEMPARYMGDSRVSNALVADGCLIEGTVENSILFRGVVVKPGAVIKDSIIMQDAVISRGARVEGCILDKQTMLRDNVTLIAPKSHPMVIAKNLTI